MNYRTSLVILIVGILLIGGWWVWKENVKSMQRDEDLYKDIIPEHPGSIGFKLQVIEALDNSSKYLENQTIVVRLNFYSQPPPQNFDLLLANLTEGKILEIRAVSMETHKPVSLRTKFISEISEIEGYSIYIGNSPLSEWEKNIHIVE